MEGGGAPHGQQAWEEPGAPVERLLAAALAAHGRAGAAGEGLTVELAAARTHLAELEVQLLGRPSGGGAGTPGSADGALEADVDAPPAPAPAPRGRPSHAGTPSEASRASRADSRGSRRISTEANSLWQVWCQNVELGPSASLPKSVRSSEGIAHVRAFFAADPAGGVSRYFHSRDRNALRRRERKKRSWQECVVLRPNTGARTAWDVLSLVVLLYDTIMMPLSLLNVGVGGMYVYTELSITIFWTLGIGVSFISGYYDVGALEIRLSQIAKRYLRGTFLFDVVVVSVDWWLTLAHFLDSSLIRLVRLGKLARFGRAARMLRLLRVMKVPQQLESISEAMNSQTFTTMLGISKTLAFIIILNHFVACVWYFLSDTLYESGERAWVDALHEEGRGIAYFYASSLHWSLTQFTPASMEIVPRNTAERVFVVLVVLTALLVFSSFLSGITNAMTHLRQHNAHRWTQLNNMTNYLVDKKISSDLSSRIAVFIRKYRFLAKRKVREQDVEVFTVLPTPLKRQLRLEAHGPILCGHPFFYQVSEFDPEWLFEVCNGTITELPVDMAQELFAPGHDALDTYFLLHGHAEYAWEEETWFFEGGAGSGGVFSEAALWIRFVHPGRLFCRTSSEFLALSSASFRTAVPRRPVLHRACCLYASRVLREMRAAARDEQFDLGPASFDIKQEIAQTAFESSYNMVECLEESQESIASARRLSFKGSSARTFEQGGPG